jgi:hypothetical protein
VHNGPPTESFWRIAPARPIVVPIDLCPPSSQNVDPESILNACVIVDHLTLLEKPGEQVGHCIRIRCHGLPEPPHFGVPSASLPTTPDHHHPDLYEVAGLSGARWRLPDHLHGGG